MKLPSRQTMIIGAFTLLASFAGVGGMVALGVLIYYATHP